MSKGTVNLVSLDNGIEELGKSHLVGALESTNSFHNDGDNVSGLCCS